MKNLFFITAYDPEIIEDILLLGLKSNALGDILLFENKTVIDSITKAANYTSDCIAQNIKNLHEYAMFEVSAEGITGEVLSVKSTLPYAKIQKLIRQPEIDPAHISLFGTYKNEFSQLKYRKSNLKIKDALPRENNF